MASKKEGGKKKEKAGKAVVAVKQLTARAVKQLTATAEKVAHGIGGEAARGKDEEDAVGKTGTSESKVREKRCNEKAWEEECSERIESNAATMDKQRTCTNA